MARAVVEARGVTKRYGQTEVLRDVSFDVPAGAMWTIAGRSGSGKSTLFKLVAGLDRPTRGEIRVDGVDVASLPDAEASELRLRRIGIVLQSFNMLPDLTLEENIRLPLDIAGVPRAAGSERARFLLDLVDMASHAHKLPNAVSGGELQRAAVARALANDPAILLADEPTGNLDSHNAGIVMDLFRKVNRDLGTTVLIVTHDALILDRLPPRLQLHDGRLVERSLTAPPSREPA